MHCSPRDLDRSYSDFYKHFSSRNLLTRLVLSDNGLTFLCAADKFKAFSLSHSLMSAVFKSGAEWQFIPKCATVLCGFWERLIGITKLALKKVLGRALTTPNGLQTTIVEIKGNDCPLACMPTDINEPNPIPPANLLYGTKIVCILYHMTPLYNQYDPDFGEKASHPASSQDGNESV